MSFTATASRLLTRFHVWGAAAWLLGRQPLTALDSTSVGRLLYALMMAHRTAPHRTSRLFQRIVQRNVNTTPQLRIELAAMANAVRALDRAESLLVQAESAPHPYTAETARCLLHVQRGLRSGSLETIIRAVLQPLTGTLKRQQLILVPLSSRYLQLWQLWLRQVRTHIGSRILVIAMDTAALSAARQESDVVALDLREFFAWESTGNLHSHLRGVLWLLRTLVLHEVVQQGYPALVLDLDAIAVGDLAPMLASLPDADVVAQKDHSIPMDVNRQLGFILCCGFMLWRPTPASIAILGRFAAECAIERDDQMALNHLLARDGITNQHEDGQCMGFQSNEVRFVCPDPSLVSRTLHSGSVIRHFQQEGQSMAELQKALGVPG